ncbi:DUF1523 family protein [Neobacillus sp. YIM B02564]|uniref:DUF1523 family protein n=1 Tax=Neobacillus paridis TaxID=2803862 RepID=A0ABS1TIG8_9BACI|nr:DUF1523 family protein [Neobacillus paridis]MBL4951062.1 DUF1523 family protein [Neobacillus paridis]
MKAKETMGCIFYGLVLLLILISLSITILGQFVSNEYTAKVTDKVVKTSNDNSKYIIFTELEDGKVKVFKNTDSLIRGKFNSSDIYAEIKVGHKYKFKVYGYRVPALSMYENIVSIKEIN